VRNFVLSKCANPACFARFRYLHEGRIFNVEMKSGSAEHYTQPRIEHFWLCESCARMLKVVWEGGAVSTRPRFLALPSPPRKKPLSGEREVA
jgi:hypothetical protein